MQMTINESERCLTMLHCYPEEYSSQIKLGIGISMKKTDICAF